MKYYLLSFLLGMVAYNFIPKDFAIADSTDVPMMQATTVTISDGNANCTTYQYAHAVNKQNSLIERTVCNK